MRIMLALVALCLFNTAFAEDRPGLLVYLSPHEYTNEVHLGLPPYFSVWVVRGPAVESAARKALAPYFGAVDACKGSNTGDVIAWVKPQLTLNPVVDTYYAKVKVQFHLGDGRHLGTLKAVGEQHGFADSLFVEDLIRKAYDAAMQDIARQFAADTKLQEAIRGGMASDFTRAPCAIVGVVRAD